MTLTVATSTQKVDSRPIPKPVTSAKQAPKISSPTNSCVINMLSEKDISIVYDSITPKNEPVIILVFNKERHRFEAQSNTDKTIQIKGLNNLVCQSKVPKQTFIKDLNLWSSISIGEQSITIEYLGRLNGGADQVRFSTDEILRSNRQGPYAPRPGEHINNSVEVPAKEQIELLGYLLIVACGIGLLIGIVLRALNADQYDSSYTDQERQELADKNQNTGNWLIGVFVVAEIASILFRIYAPECVNTNNRQNQGNRSTTV